LFDDQEQGGLLLPILILAHDYDLDPEMRPYKEPINAKRRKDLLVGIAAGIFCNLTLYMSIYMMCQNVSEETAHSTKTEREARAFGASQAFN
jgi:hypothetical protein